MDLLEWVRGPWLTWSFAIFIVGLIGRLAFLYFIGHGVDRVPPKGNPTWGGTRHLVAASLYHLPNLRRTQFTYGSAALFHLGLLVIVFFFGPHLLFIHDLTGLFWPALPAPVIDGVAVVTMVTLLAVLFHRLTTPVLRLMSDTNDYIAWLLTFLPILTGYLTIHNLTPNYPLTLAIHIMSFELLLVLLPFTKLAHTGLIFVSRFLTGYEMGKRGVGVRHG
ncbi:MAG: hypothetical protein COX57_13025 [Alphaproteobacteria bacterium CG_4_10_14_0_2_um_filter_63_37]|nr:MAG: hypothetical protein AUJ55_04840 [Proteobacteria bacterium CG1_02_64_396]PJA23630.1 MAG: hypothetical protein COX57_13025 [Alphaproteobacteria bacterium CG_4_10_14_0_2_um_filter_63_37]